MDLRNTNPQASTIGQLIGGVQSSLSSLEVKHARMHGCSEAVADMQEVSFYQPLNRLMLDETTGAN